VQAGLLNILSREEEKVLAPQPVLMSACCRGHGAQLVRQGAAGLQGECLKFICSDNTLRIESGFLILWLFWIIRPAQASIPTLYSIFTRGIKHASKEVSLAALKCTTTFLA
jgi:hypothetical protein